MSKCVTVSRTLNYSTHLAEQFLSLKENGSMVDFKIRVGDETLECHRLILAANSPVLQRMILSEMKEGTNQEVTLDTIPPHIVKAILRYMYTGEGTFQTEHLIDIIKATDYLQMEELKDLCLKHVPGILCPANVLSWLRVSDQLQLEEMKIKCKELLCTSFKGVSEGEEFLQLSLAEVIEYISDARERDVGSDYLVKAAFVWTNYEVENRVSTMENILEKINLADCSTEVMNEMIKSYSAVLQANPIFFKLFTEFYIQKDLLTKAKKAGEGKFVSLFVIGGEGNKKCWLLDSQKQLQEITQIPEDSFSNYHSVCAVDVTCFVLTGGRGSSVCIMYTVAAKVWKKLHDMLAVRKSHGSVCIDGVLFVIGGEVSRSWSASVDYLNVDGGSWQRGPPMPAALTYPKVASIGTGVFVMGDYSDRLFHLDTESKSWSTKAPLTESPGWDFSMAAADDKLYIAGGENKICSWYSATTNSWTKASSPGLMHHDGAFVFHENKLLLLGGFDCADVEEYDIERDSWAVSAFKLPCKVGYPHAFVMNAPQ